MDNTTHNQEIIHLSQSIALMRSLNNHLLQTRGFDYGLSVEDTIEDALFQLDLAINELDQVRDQYARKDDKHEKKESMPINPPPMTTKPQRQIPVIDPMETIISRNIPALIKQQMAQQNGR